MREVEFNGVKYRSMAEASKATGIPAATIAFRLDKGLPVDKRRVGLPFEYKGVVYENQTACAKAFGLPVRAMRKRIKSGMPLELPLVGKHDAKNWKPQHNPPYIFEGKEFKNRREAAKHHGVSVSTIYQWSKHKLHTKPISLFGREFKSVEEGAEFYGVSEREFRQWLINN